MEERQQVETAVWEDGFIQVKVPLPFSLRWVNSYLIPEDGGGYVMIDPGLRTDEAIAAWGAAFRIHSLRPSGIKRILLTHQHPDHYGLAGYFQERTGAPVFITERAHAYTQRLWGERGDFTRELKTLFAEHGMPAELTGAIEDNLNSFLPQVSPQPRVAYMEAGQTMRFGRLDWRLIDAPGHAYGQVCFYAREKGYILCGDQVMPRITPNVSVVPGEEKDPLEAFLASLEELGKLEVKRAFPGHRDPFDRFAERTAELIQHHKRRLDQMLEELAEPRTGFELCELHFGGRLRTNPHNLRFAMQETLAHVFYLERRGLIAGEKDKGAVRYGRA